MSLHGCVPEPVASWGGEPPGQRTQPKHPRCLAHFGLRERPCVWWEDQGSIFHLLWLGPTYPHALGDGGQDTAAVTLLAPLLLT